MSQVVLIMAGGTGGHVFPALAVAQAFKEQGFEVHWLGSKAGIEGQLVPKRGFPLHTLSVRGLRGQGILRKIKAPWLLARALWDSLTLMRRLQPVMVLGLGGFASGPGGLAARILGIPLAIHEQNAVAGMTNRILAKWANPIMQAFPDTLPNAVTLGNPLRSEVVHCPAPEERWAHRTGPIRLLVLGGSLGALILNQQVPKAMALLEEGDRPDIWHQYGQQHLELTQGLYADVGVKAKVTDFIEDMAQAMAWADVVICRAGALTVSEVAAIGVPALFVPYPYAVDDHQTKNAQWLVDTGSAALVQQKDLNEKVLLKWFVEQAQQRDQLLIRAQAARAQAQVHATEHVVEHCLQRINS